MSVIIDGKSSILGVVEDLSARGVRVTQIPRDFDFTLPRCKAVINCPGGDFTLTLRTCWVKETNRGVYRTIGFQIVEPPAVWTAFVKELEGGSTELGSLVLDSDKE
jgi:hypothetical protein